MIEYIALAICVFVVWRSIKRAARAELELDRALDRLERWRDAYDQMRALLAEFPDAADSLDLMREIGEGRRSNFGSVIQLRSEMRTRRAAATGDRRFRPRHAHTAHTAGVTGTTTGAPL
jgi:hypothetical protein